MWTLTVIFNLYGTCSPPNSVWIINLHWPNIAWTYLQASFNEHILLFAVKYIYLMKTFVTLSTTCCEKWWYMEEASLPKRPLEINNLYFCNFLVLSCHILQSSPIKDLQELLVCFNYSIFISVFTQWLPYCLLILCNNFSSTVIQFILRNLTIFFYKFNIMAILCIVKM